MEQRRSTLLPGVNGAYQQDARARLLDKIKQHSSAPAEVPAAPGCRAPVVVFPSSPLPRVNQNCETRALFYQ